MKTASIDEQDFIQLLKCKGGIHGICTAVMRNYLQDEYPEIKTIDVNRMMKKLEKQGKTRRVTRYLSNKFSGWLYDYNNAPVPAAGD